MGDYLTAALSHVGVVRDNNEDYVLTSKDAPVWILADGVGGHDAGEIASELACNQIMQAIHQGNSINESILLAHQAILKAAKNGHGKAGMATTIVVMVADEDLCQISWVGDSRAYLIDENGCSQLTEDHSLVQELVNAGQITKEEAVTHPSKNVVLQVLGMTEPDIPKVSSLQQYLEKDDMVLLCSDGLSDVVTESEIFRIINAADSLEAAANRLIELAIENGSRDNITVELVKRLTDKNNKSNGTLISETCDKPVSKGWIGRCLSLFNKVK